MHEEDAVPRGDSWVLVTAESPTSSGQPLMRVFDPIRALVSQEKERYTSGGFDLDLTYITPRVIAMGFPATGLESCYRNELTEVERFLEAHHPEHYRVYNLCCERSYPPSSFRGNVATFGFIDHTPPPLGLLVACLQDMAEHLAADSANVCVVHCKAGKGRTGVVVCCHLLLTGRSPTLEAALKDYAATRTRDGQGVTIPSQRRFVGYFAQCLQRGRVVLPPRQRLRLQRVEFSPCPWKTSSDLAIDVVGLRYGLQGVTDQVVLLDLHISPESSPGCLVFRPGRDVPLEENFDLRLHRLGKKKPVLHFWLNSRFVGERLTLCKAEIDGPHLDLHHTTFPAAFCVTCDFEVLSAAIPETLEEVDARVLSPLSLGSVSPDDNDGDHYDQDLSLL
eukprot:EG_transcript_8449